jgi:Zn-dependent protease
MKCDKCGIEVFLPFKCQYCGGRFCSEHRLPENHQCPQIQLARLPKEEIYPTAVRNAASYEHTVTYPPFERIRGRTRFSTKEIQHLAIATLLVIGVGLSMMIPYFQFSVSDIDYVFVASATLVFTASFFIHEMAHKVTAQRNGLWAEFRLTLLGALVTLLSALSPLFKIISPGAVMVSGYADRKRIGEISIAGPVTNIILSTTFLTASFLLPIDVRVFVLGAYFNSWISLINLIPYGIFDGYKVFSWSKFVWALCFSAAVALTLLSYNQYTTHFT